MSDLCNHERLERCDDGLGSPDDQAALDAHVVECRACADELAWRARERKLFADRPSTATDALWAGVVDRLAPPVPLPMQNPRPSRRWGNWAGGLAAAAAAVLVLVKVVPMSVPSVAVHGSRATIASKSAEHGGEGTHLWKLSVGPKATLTVENVAGLVDVSIDDDRDDGLIVVKATYDELPSDWRVETSHDTDDILVRSGCTTHACWKSPEVTLTVSLPKGNTMPVRISNVSGEVDANVGAGPLTISTVSGDVLVQGGLRLGRVTTVSGDISVSSVTTHETELRSTSGEIQWSGLCADRCKLSVTTVSGEVELSPTKDSDYTVEAHSVSGSIDDDRKTVRKTVQHGAGTITVSTVSGDIDLDASYDADAYEKGE